MPKMNLESRPVSPSITATDIQRSIKFYVEGLGFTITDRHEADGKVRFVVMKAGDAEISLGQDDFAKGRDRTKGVGMRLWLTTSQDLKALSEQVKAAGFTPDNEVAPLPWGPLGFAVTDPDGVKLTIANPR